MIRLQCRAFLTVPKMHRAAPPVRQRFDPHPAADRLDDEFLCVRAADVDEVDDVGARGVPAFEERTGSHEDGDRAAFQPREERLFLQGAGFLEAGKQGAPFRGVADADQGERGVRVLHLKRQFLVVLAADELQRALAPAQEDRLAQVGEFHAGQRVRLHAQNSRAVFAEQQPRVGPLLRQRGFRLPEQGVVDCSRGDLAQGLEERPQVVPFVLDVGIHRVDQRQHERQVIQRFQAGRPAQLRHAARDVGQRDERFQDDALPFGVADFGAPVLECDVFPFVQIDVLAVAVLDECFQVVFLDRRQNVFGIGERGREIEQEPGPRHDRVIRLPPRVFLPAFMRFVQQDVPFAAVLVVAVIDQRLFLHVGNVVAAVVIDGCGVAEPALARLAAVAQWNELDVQTGPIELFDGAADLPQKMIARGEDEGVVGWNFAVFLQPVQIFDQLDHDQRLSAAGRHPETHPVDEFPVRNRFALRRNEVGQDAEDRIFFQVPLVRGVLVLLDRERMQVHVAVAVGEDVPASLVAVGRFRGLVIALVFSVIQVEGAGRVSQRVRLIVVERLLGREPLDLRHPPRFGQVAVVHGLGDGFK